MSKVRLTIRDSNSERIVTVDAEDVELRATVDGYRVTYTQESATSIEWVVTGEHPVMSLLDSSAGAS